MKKIIFGSMLLLASTMPSQAIAGNFSRTCSNMVLYGSTLAAYCKDRNQQFKEAYIKLDNAIGNLDGVLSWGDHNFSHTCSNISLNGATLSAVCTRMNGSQNRTWINLDEHIDNTNGVLRFD